MSQVNDFRARIARQLLLAIKDPNPNLRFLALEGLQFCPGIPEIERILPLLTDNDRFVKWKAIQIAGLLRLKSAGPYLLKLLFSPDMNTRSYSALALGHLSDPLHISALGDLFSRENSAKVRQSIIRSLGGFTETIPWEILSKAALDEDVGVRLDLAKVLGGIAPNPTACDILLNLIEQETNTHVFATAILSLGRFQQPKLLGYFQHSLQHQDPRIRGNAIEALGRLPFDQIETLLTPFLKDSSSRVRANVVSIFIENGKIDAVMPEIDRMLDSTNRWERASGAWLAGNYCLVNALPALIRLLNDEEAVVAERCAWSLGRLRAPNTFKILWNAYQTASQWALTHIIKAMYEVATKCDVDALITLLEKERSPLIKSQIMDIITSLRETKVRDIIVSYRTDSDIRVRLSVYKYLGTVVWETSSALLREGLNDTNAKIRGMCADLMMRAGDLSGLSTLSNLLNDHDKLQRVQKVSTLRELAALFHPADPS
ncbi:MAG: HEAT repeat domain-containing protein [Candidatus Riflebacteria bacterium]|nr:HEAT repeat domain-containing protein [Candidatus Riflebacteria bacterium]